MAVHFPGNISTFSVTLHILNNWSYGMYGGWTPMGYPRWPACPVGSQPSYVLGAVLFKIHVYPAFPDSSPAYWLHNKLGGVWEKGWVLYMAICEIVKGLNAFAKNFPQARGERYGHQMEQRACIWRHLVGNFCMFLYTCRHFERQWIGNMYGEAYSMSSLWGTEHLASTLYYAES